MPARDDGADLLENLAPAFGFDRFRAGGDQALGRCAQRAFGGFIAAIGQIGREQGAGFGAGSRAHVVFHLRHGHVGRVRVTQHHHAQGIAHQDQRHARLVQQPGHGKIVGRQRGDRRALHGADGHSLECVRAVMLVAAASHRFDLPETGQQFFRGDGGGADFADHDAGGVIGKDRPPPAATRRRQWPG